LALRVPGASASAPQALEQELLRASKEVIKHCKDKGYQNVGVLKFQITKDDTTLSANVGTLNVFLARRLKVALVLSNNPLQPIGIIDNAPAVAHRTKGANHLSKEGRLKLFEASYPLAWGQAEVKPDAFITGVAEVSEDLETLRIQLLTFDKTDNRLLPLLSAFTVANQPDQLTEMGESFNTLEPAGQECGGPPLLLGRLHRHGAVNAGGGRRGTPPPLRREKSGESGGSSVL
jgi:hypothetical protein